jgi:hypothetical protein
MLNGDWNFLMTKKGGGGRACNIVVEKKSSFLGDRKISITFIQW